MDTANDRRWVLSVVAALVVGAVVVAGWWLSQPRSTGDTAGVAAGGSAPVDPGDPGAAGGGSTGHPGSVDRGASGSDPAATGGTAAGQPSVGRHPVLRKHGVRVDGYTARGNRLLLRYTTGVPECYGEVEVAEVTEDAKSVTVRLVTVPPPQTAEACIDLAVLGTATVELARPLGQRTLLDGAFDPAVKVRWQDGREGGR